MLNDQRRSRKESNNSEHVGKESQFERSCEFYLRHSSVD